jgi:adenine-specific DNA-methyltransferase
LIERVVLALTKKNDLVYDPFCGVGSAGVACAIHERKFWGTEINDSFINIGQERLSEALRGTARYRPHDKPIYDHRKSNLSKRVIN